MIGHLHLKNFTKFEDADFRFVHGLNVFVGVNGSGKSHVLKLLYANMRALTSRKDFPSEPVKSFLNGEVAQRLVGVFRPDQGKLGRLASRRQGMQKCAVEMDLRKSLGKFHYGFSTRSLKEVQVESFPPHWLGQGASSVFLPSREMLSIYPGFAYVYDHSEIPFEETWRDLAVLLSAPRLRGPRLESVRKILPPLEKALGGDIVLDGGAFYVHGSRGNLEAHLLAEGLRKIGTITQLLVNGTLTRQSCLFWDEPEANLNPRLIIRVAETIAQLVELGIQVFIATHSLFLLRQLQLLSGQGGALMGKSRYFTLTPQEEEGAAIVDSAESIDALPGIASLDCQVEQDAQVLKECYGYEC